MQSPHTTTTFHPSIYLFIYHFQLHNTELASAHAEDVEVGIATLADVVQAVVAVGLEVAGTQGHVLLGAGGHTGVQIVHCV